MNSARTAPYPGLGVVILSFGRAQLHRTLVHELVEEHRVEPSSIIIVHNAYGPDDEWVPDPPVGGVRVLRTGDNLGYAGGMNLGIAAQMAQGSEWILCLTHEVTLGEDCVGRLVSQAYGHDDLGIVGPVLVDKVSHQTFSAGVIAIRGGVRHITEVESDQQLLSRDAVDGSALLIRATAYRDMGPLDERMFMYWEETELCLRARRHGWRVAVATESTALAAPGGPGRNAAHAYLTARNGLLYARSMPSRWAVPARLMRTGYEIWRAIPKPGGRRSRDAAMWRLGAVRSAATVWGVVDFARDRYGPPPARLTRGTDIRPSAAPATAGEAEHLSNL